MKRKAFRFFALALLMAAVLIRSAECAAGAKRGIETALSVLIPAFFPFLILVSLSGASLALLCGFFLATLQNGVEIRKEI